VTRRHYRSWAGEVNARRPTGQVGACVVNRDLVNGEVIS
jgi:hypothetical protein